MGIPPEQSLETAKVVKVSLSMMLNLYLTKKSFEVEITWLSLRANNIGNRGLDESSRGVFLIGDFADDFFIIFPPPHILSNT